MRVGLRLFISSIWLKRNLLITQRGRMLQTWNKDRSDDRATRKTPQMRHGESKMTNGKWFPEDVVTMEYPPVLGPCITAEMTHPVHVLPQRIGHSEKSSHFFASRGATRKVAKKWPNGQKPPK